MMIGKNRGVGNILRYLPKHSVGVEIGAWRGDSSVQFLRRCRFLHIVDPWSVDAYAGPNEQGGFDAYIRRYAELVGSSNPADFQRYYDDVYETVCERFAHQPVIVHRMTSRQFFATFNGVVDWVYIDGSHEYATVLQDIVDALQIVRDSVWGDDYSNKPGVTEAVNETAQSRPLKLYGRNQWRLTV